MFYVLRFKKNGFTVPEMLIVFTIMVILSAVVFANYKEGEQQFILRRVSYKLAQDIRKIQAMAGLAEDGCRKDGDFRPEYKYGYGIYFKKTEDKQYILFADCDGNKKYNPKDINMETVDLDVELLGVEVGAVIEDLRIDSVSGNTKLSIVFTPPDPSVSIKDESGNEGNLAEIDIALERYQQEIKTINVNKIGLIDID